MAVAESASGGSMLNTTPSPLDLEQEFINHLAIQASLEYILREGVSNELLMAPRTKSVYNFVQHHFSDTGKLPSAKMFATEFPNIVFERPEATVQYIVDKLRERYQRSQVQDMLVSVAEVAQRQPAEAMKRLREATFEIEKNSLSSRHVWQPGDHKLFLRNLQQKVLAGAYKGAPIGLDEIDAFTGGVKDGNLAYVLARPKRQKTFISLHAFIAFAKADKFPYLPTLENTEEEIMLRLSCMLSGVPWDMAQKGALTAKEYKLFDQAWSDFNQYRWAIEMPPMDERTVPIILNKADKIGAESIIISQFRYLKGVKDWYRSDHEEKAEIAVDLKRAAIRPGAERPIIVEAQFNRGGDTMEELEDFDASKVGLTDMIPQSADTLYGLFQNKDMRNNNQIEFGILEARNHGKAAWFIKTDYINKTEIALERGSQH